MRTKVKKLNYYKKPEDIFYALHKEKYAVFLDSSLQNQLGRYSIIAVNPYLILREENGICYESRICYKDRICYENEQEQLESIEERIRYYLEQYQEGNPFDLPLISGAVGYFSYDYGRKFEEISTRHEKKIQMPEALFVFYDNFIIADTKKKELYCTSREELKTKEEAFEELEHFIQDSKEQKLPEKTRKKAKFAANFNKEEYKDAVNKMISYIIEGDIYIANMTQQLMIESKKKPYEMYQYLRTYNPAPFGGYLNYGEFQIVCASMERFLQVKDGIIETRPIKGTRKRGENPLEDAKLKKELQESEKDRSELLMIVDLERNDLNHICKAGSVKVTENFAIETYATVFHLVSTIQGEIEENKSKADLLRAAFPGGSITGAPKIRAMEIIDELEHDRRGLYTGSIGYFSFDGNCDFNIVIRTAVHQDGKYVLGVGGGITCESDLEFEYEETIQKAKALLEAAVE